jgi:hypothetical protein
MAWTLDGNGCITNTDIHSSKATYLSAFPKDPQAPSKCYKGFNETSTTPTKYCAYAALESGTNLFFVASHAGVGTKTGAPTSVDDCRP